MRQYVYGVLILEQKEKKNTCCFIHLHSHSVRHFLSTCDICMEYEMSIEMRRNQRSIVRGLLQSQVPGTFIKVCFWLTYNIQMIHLHFCQRQKGNETRSLISSSSLSSGGDKHINITQSHSVNTVAHIHPKNCGSIEEGGMNSAGHVGRAQRGGNIWIWC